MIDEKPLEPEPTESDQPSGAGGGSAPESGSDQPTSAGGGGELLPESDPPSGAGGGGSTKK